MSAGRLVATSAGSVLLGTLKVTLDGSGSGSGSIGPQRAGEVWKITNTAINCTGAVPANGAASTWIETLYGQVMDSSYSVIQDQSDTAIDLYPGALLVSTWSNSPAGGTATVSYYGTRHAIR